MNIDKLQNPEVWSRPGFPGRPWGRKVTRKCNCDNGCDSKDNGGIMERVTLWDGEDPDTCYHASPTQYERRGDQCRNCGRIVQLREYKAKS